MALLAFRPLSVTVSETVWSDWPRSMSGRTERELVNVISRSSLTAYRVTHETVLTANWVVRRHRYLGCPG